MMSLRTRFFLTLCVLLAASSVAQLLLVRSLSADLDREVDSMALVVGSRVAQVVAAGLEPCPEGEPCPAPTLSWVGNDGTSEEIHLSGHGEFDVFTSVSTFDSNEIQGSSSGNTSVTTIRLVPGPDEGEDEPSEASAERGSSQAMTWVYELENRPSPEHEPGMDPTHEDHEEDREARGSDQRVMVIPTPIFSRTAREPSGAPLDANGPNGSNENADTLHHDQQHGEHQHGEHDTEGPAGGFAFVTTSEGNEPTVHWHTGPNGEAIRTQKTFVRRISNRPEGHPDGHGEEDHHGHADGRQIFVTEDSGEAIRLHVDSHADGHFLMVQRPDLIGRVPIPQQGLRERLAHFQQRLLLGSASLLFLGLVVAALIAQRMTAPLRTLSTASARVAEGELGIRVPEDSGDRDLRRTLGAFNHMSSRLAELDARNRQLQAARHMGEIGDIARGLAHSLRNPLNALGLSVDELANRATDAAPDTRDTPSTRLALSARRQIQRLDEGIRSFLLLASQSGGAVETVNVANLVRDVGLEAIQDGNRRAGLDLRIEDDGEEKGRFELPAVVPELRAVVQALVVNALEASPEDERVIVRLESLADAETQGISPDTTGDHEPHSREGIRLVVEDRGPGFAPEIRERLFTPHLSTKPNGSGMGLFLAHRITHHRYDGTLEVFEREGGGSRVVLSLGPRSQLEREVSP